MLQQRIKKIKKFIVEKDLDAILISSPYNIVYFTNFSGFSQIERDGFLLILKDRQFILTNPLYSKDVKKQVKNFELIEVSPKLPMKDALIKLGEKYNIKKLGFEKNNLKFSE